MAQNPLSRPSFGFRPGTAGGGSVEQNQALRGMIPSQGPAGLAGSPYGTLAYRGSYSPMMNRLGQGNPYQLRGGYGSIGGVSAGPTMGQNFMGGSSGSSSVTMGSPASGMAWNPLTHSFVPRTGLGGGVTSAGGTAGFPSTIQGLLQQQIAENQNARGLTLGAYNEAKDYLLGGPGQFAANPLNPQAQQNALALAQNPEAINDQTQQQIINRQMNLVNAAADQRQKDALGALAASGQLGTGDEQVTLDRLNKARQATLADEATKLDIARANQRNQDIINATKLAGAEGNRQYAPYADTAHTLFTNPLRVNPMDLSGLVAGLDFGPTPVGGAAASGFGPSGGSIAGLPGGYSTQGPSFQGFGYTKDWKNFAPDSYATGLGGLLPGGPSLNGNVLGSVGPSFSPSPGPQYNPLNGGFGQTTTSGGVPVLAGYGGGTFGATLPGGIPSSFRLG